MPGLLKHATFKGAGAVAYHRRLDSIEFDGEWLRATIKSLTTGGKGTHKTLVLIPLEGWKQVPLDRYSIALNVSTGEFSCDCPQGSLGNFCKHCQRLREYAEAKGMIQ